MSSPNDATSHVVDGGTSLFPAVSEDPQLRDAMFEIIQDEHRSVRIRTRQQLRRKNKLKVEEASLRVFLAPATLPQNPFAPAPASSRAVLPLPETRVQDSGSRTQRPAATREGLHLPDRAVLQPVCLERTPETPLRAPT